MALALSASLAHSEASRQQEEEATALAACGVPEEDLALKASLDVPEVILPSAAWPNKSKQTQTKEFAGSRHSKTPLEVRTEEERAKRIAEEVSHLLSEQNVEAKPAVRKCSSPTTDGVRKYFVRGRALWDEAGTNSRVPSEINLHDAITTREAKAQTPSKSRPPLSNKSVTVDEKAARAIESSLSNAWEELFDSKERTDLLVYTKDEGVLACHSLVLFARCKQALQDCVTERSGRGEERSILSWECATLEAASVFLRYIYCGQLDNIERRSTLDGVRALASRYSGGASKQLLELLKKVRVEFLMTEKDEEEEEKEHGDESARKSSFLFNSWSPFGDTLESKKSKENGVSVNHNEEEKKEEEEVYGSAEAASATGSDDDLFLDEEGDCIPESEAGAANHMLEPFELVGSESSTSHSSSQQEKKSSQATSSPQKSESGPDVMDVDGEYNDNDFDNFKEPGEISPSKSSQSERFRTNASFAHFETMSSPALKLELKRFGLKVLPRCKAVPLLQHIHRELRSHTEADEQHESSTESSQEGDDVPEESFRLVEEEAAALESPHIAKTDDLAKQVLAFIKSNRALYAQVLVYDPIWLEDFAAEFRDKTGVNVKLAQIMDILDTQCITFRTQNSSKRRRKMS
jgi:hypothetical protein